MASFTITDIKKLFCIQVYTTEGHYSLLAGSEREATITANLLFFCSRPVDFSAVDRTVYKVKVLDHYDNVVYELV